MFVCFLYHDRDVLEDIHLQTLLARRHSLSGGGGGFIYGSVFGCQFMKKATFLFLLKTCERLF